MFYVQAGTATFRTKDGDVEVAAGDVNRFAPGQFQLGRDAAAERLRGPAIGAPRDPLETENLWPCPVRGEETLQTLVVDRAAGEVRVGCAACGEVVEVVEPYFTIRTSESVECLVASHST